MNIERVPVDSVAVLEQRIESVRAAQRAFSAYSQEQVDAIFRAAALAANKARLSLAKLAVEETGMGVVEDKVIKNNYAAEYIYNAYKNTPTCGVIEEDEAAGVVKIAEPIHHDHQSHLNRDLQMPHIAQNAQRHHHFPPSPRQEQHHSGRAHRS